MLHPTGRRKLQNDQEFEQYLRGLEALFRKNEKCISIHRALNQNGTTTILLQGTPPPLQAKIVDTPRRITAVALSDEEAYLMITQIADLRGWDSCCFGGPEAFVQHAIKRALSEGRSVIAKNELQQKWLDQIQAELIKVASDVSASPTPAPSPELTTALTDAHLTEEITKKFPSKTNSSPTPY